MSGKCLIQTAVMSVLPAALVLGQITTKEAAYRLDKPGVRGYFAAPEGSGPFPALVVIHEWWGLNEQIRSQAESFARRGFVALAVDLYNGKVATDPEDARRYASEAGEDVPDVLMNLNAAVDYLKGQSQIDGESIGSIGWCFGGGWSLQLALHRDDLAATVIYYGNLVSDPEKLKKIAWPVLGVFGAEDRHPSPDDVAAFRKGLTEAGLIHELYSYPGAGHAFANPSAGARYRQEAAEDAMMKTLAFLDKYLKRDKY